MKKTTLLILCLLVNIYTYSQQTISFETSEGFALGDLNTQNGWVVTGCGDACFVLNQEVSDDYATNGTFSLKTAVDPNSGSQAGPIIGGFYNFASPIDYTDAIVSYDIYITQQDENSSNFRFGIIGGDGTGGLFFIYAIDFDFQGNIKTIDTSGSFENVGTWSIATWYNVRAEVTGSNVTYFIDDDQVATSIILNDDNFTSLRFVHDNFGGDGYIDNIRINDEELSVENFNANSFTHFYNKNTGDLTLESSNSPFNNIKIFNILGQQVLNKKLSQTNETINMSNLIDGIYLAKITIEGKTKTIKLLKH